MARQELINLCNQYEVTMGEFEGYQTQIGNHPRAKALADEAQQKLVKLANTLRHYGIQVNPYDPDDTTVGQWLLDNE